MPTPPARSAIMLSMICDSCGSTENELVSVHRMYVTPEAWDTVAKEVVMPEVEQWCVACALSYPHERVE
jgi:hypothetical protein